MWQAPNQRIDAIKNAKKRQQERLKRPLHLARVRAEVRLVPNQETHAQATTQGAQGETIDARVMLNDLSPHGIGIYSQKRMNPGLAIQITLDEPQKITISGNVVWCQEQPACGAIISSEAHNFRIGVKFKFNTPEEEKAFQEYCALVQKQHLYRPTP